MIYDVRQTTTCAYASPVAQAQVQMKSGNELMSFIQLSRTLGWSSTKAILSGDFAEILNGGLALAGLDIFYFLPSTGAGFVLVKRLLKNQFDHQGRLCIWMKGM